MLCLGEVVIVKINFVGDIHGNYPILPILEESTTPVVALGDFNLFGYSNWFKKIGDEYYPFPYSFQKPIFFIDGNHDNHPILNIDSGNLQEVEKNLFYIPRGYVSGKTLFIGGADSIDKDKRTPGHDWFPEEAISQKQIYRILSLEQKIEVIVSHEAPLSYIEKLMNSVYIKPSQIALQEVFEHFKPQLWLHGHYHLDAVTQHQDCKFISLGVNRGIEVDVPVDKDLFLSPKNYS